MASKSKKQIKSSKILGLLLILSGFFIISSVLILTQLDLLAPAKKTIILQPNTQNIDQTPAFVQITGTMEKIPVQKGYYKYGVWQLSDKNALYLTSSGIPNKPGNIVIYGHNTQNIFANLQKAQPGELIEIETDSKQKLTYKIDTKKTVLPTAVEILEQGPDQRITLYTCTGVLDSMRLVVSGTRV